MIDQGNMETLEVFVKLWAKQVGLTDGSTIEKQAMKLISEVGELFEEILNGNIENARMELGDCFVIMFQIANRLETDSVTCVSMAYDKISNRECRMVNGTLIRMESKKEAK